MHASKRPLERRALGTGLLGICLAITAPIYAADLRDLPSQHDVPRLAKILGASTFFPREEYRVAVDETKDGETLHLAIEEVGPKGAGCWMVLLHGLASDRESWRFVAGELGWTRRLLLVDLLGAGASDRPDPRDLGPHGYDATSQAYRVLAALDARLARAQELPCLVLVGHSLGGSVALRMLGDERLRAEFPEVFAQVRGAVLLAPVDFAVEKAHPTFRRLARLGASKVRLAALLGMLDDRVAGVTLRSVTEPERALREEARRLLRTLRRRDSRRAMKAMIRQSVPFDLETERPDWEGIEALVADYANVEVPTLIVWGARDETLPVSMGYKLRAQLPRAWLVVLPRCMHSPALERPALVAELVRDFAASRGEGWPPIREHDGQEPRFEVATVVPDR